MRYIEVFVQIPPTIISVARRQLWISLIYREACAQMSLTISELPSVGASLCDLGTETLVGLAVTALSCVLVDLVGRRPLLLTSQALMLPFLGGLVLYFGLTSGPEPTVCDASRLGWFAVVRQNALACFQAMPFCH